MPDRESPSPTDPADQDLSARILVVDDEPTLRLGFRLALATEGHEVAEAGDGEEALACLEKEAIDLMVLDLRMPHLDGIGVLRRLAAAARTIPTVIASAQLNPKVALEALRLGAVNFLNKPVKPEELRAVTREVAVEEAAYAAAAASPLQKARCLLRRRRPADAAAALEKAPESRARDFWLTLARSLRDSAQALPDGLRIERLFDRPDPA